MSKTGGSVLLACLASLSFGLQSAIIATAQILVPQSFPLLSDSVWLMSAFTSAHLVGALAGTFLFGHMADVKGRRPALLFINIFYLLAGLMQGLCWDTISLILARFAVGLAIGGSTAVVPVYVAEISPAESRGRFGTLIQFCVTFGIISSFFIGYLFTALQLSWRGMFACTLAVPAFPLLFQRYLIESPRYLDRRSRKSEENAILLPLTNVESTSVSFKSLLLNRPVQLAIIVNILQQLSGFNILVFYSAVIFKKMGFVDGYALLASGISALPQLLCLFAVSAVLDRIGRRQMLISSAATLALMMFCLAYISDDNNNHIPQIISVVVILLTRLSFSIGLGPVVPIYAAEVLPNELRSRGMSLAVFMNWFCNMTITFTFLPLSNLIGTARMFLFYGCISAVGAAILYLTMHETKGRTLSGVDADDDFKAQDDEEVLI